MVDVRRFGEGEEVRKEKKDGLWRFKYTVLSPSQILSNQQLRGEAHHLIWGQQGVQAGGGEEQYWGEGCADD